MEMNKNETMSVLTEVGVFGELDIDDPTAQQLKKKKQEDIDSLIQEAITENATNLSSL